MKQDIPNKVTKSSRRSLHWMLDPFAWAVIIFFGAIIFSNQLYAEKPSTGRSVYYDAAH